MAISLSRIRAFSEAVERPTCIAVARDGTIFVGSATGAVYRVSGDGKKAAVVAKTGGSVTGLAIAPDDAADLAVCDVKKRAVMRVEVKSGKVGVWASGGLDEAGKVRAMERPARVAFARDGTLYVSDAGEAAGEPRRGGKGPVESGVVYRIDADGNGKVWASSLAQPVGILVGPWAGAEPVGEAEREEAVFVVCAGMGGVERIRISPDGTAGERLVWTRVAPAGGPEVSALVLDKRLNMYVSFARGGRICKVGPDRFVMPFVEDPEESRLSSAVDMAFAGKRFDNAYTVDAVKGRIVRVDMLLKGWRRSS